MAPGVAALAEFESGCYHDRVFGIGYLELMVLGLLIILLFPPRELPKLARQAARAYGSVRRMADEFHRTVMLDDELRSPIDEIRGAYDEARWDIRRAGDRIKGEIDAAGRGLKSAVQGAPDRAADPDNYDDGDDEELDEDERAYLEHGDGPWASSEMPAPLGAAPQDNDFQNHLQNEFQNEPQKEHPPHPGAQQAPPPRPSTPPPPVNPAAAATLPPPVPPAAATPPAASFSPSPSPSASPSPRVSAGPPPAPVVQEDDLTPVAPSKAAREPVYQSPYGAPKTVAPKIEPGKLPVPGRVAASQAQIPGAASRTVEKIMDLDPSEAAPATKGGAVPQSGMPLTDSGNIDESALTRVARLPQPPSLGDDRQDQPRQDPPGPRDGAPSKA